MSRSAGRRRDEQHLVRRAGVRLRRGVMLARTATALLPLVWTALRAHDWLCRGRFYGVFGFVFVACPLMRTLSLSLWSRP